MNLSNSSKLAPAAIFLLLIGCSVVSSYKQYDEFDDEEQMYDRRSGHHEFDDPIHESRSGLSDLHKPHKSQPSSPRDHKSDDALKTLTDIIERNVHDKRKKTLMKDFVVNNFGMFEMIGRNASQGSDGGRGGKRHRSKNRAFFCDIGVWCTDRQKVEYGRSGRCDNEICKCRDTDTCKKPECPMQYVQGRKCPKPPECHPACALKTILFEHTKENVTTTTTANPEESERETTKRPRRKTTSKPKASKTTTKPKASKTTTEAADKQTTTKSPDESKGGDDESKAAKKRDRRSPAEQVIQKPRYSSYGEYLLEKRLGATVSNAVKDMVYQQNSSGSQKGRELKRIAEQAEQAELLKLLGDRYKETGRSHKNRVMWSQVDDSAKKRLEPALLGHLLEFFDYHRMRDVCGCPNIRCKPFNIKDCEVTCHNTGDDCNSYRCQCLGDQ